MARSRFGRWPLLLGAFLALAACVQGGTGRDRDGEEELVQSGNVTVTERDVESPEVFKANETGLWDGRPSLGGVWIAHPDVVNPERALIRNETNGKSVVGALFRRERANPGPRLQLSSDAAERLGILAGQPTQLSVVALRRKEVEETAAAPTADQAIPTEGDPQAAETAEVTEAAAAAIATAEATEGNAEAVEPQPVPEDEPPTSLGRRQRPAAAPAAAAAAASVATKATEATGEAAAAATDVAPGAADPAALAAEPLPVPEDKPPTSLGQRNRPAAAAGVAAGVATAEPGTEDATDGTTVPLAEPQPVPEDKPPTSLGRRRQPADETDPLAGTAPAEDISVAPLDATAPAAEVSGAALPEPYLQAASFRSEAAANGAVAALLGAGLSAEARPSEQNGTTLWRVVVGPVATVAERDALVERLRSLGYRDAVPVPG